MYVYSKRTDVTIVGISPESPEVHAKMKRNYGDYLYKKFYLCTCACLLTVHVFVYVFAFFVACMHTRMYVFAISPDSSEMYVKIKADYCDVFGMRVHVHACVCLVWRPSCMCLYV
jgi:hypothetical protein